MGEYVRYCWTVLACSLVLGGGLHFLLAGWVPPFRKRLRITVPATLLSFAVALLIPPMIAVSRGMTVLPAWSAWLVPTALFFLLPLFWRAMTTRMGEGQEDTPEWLLPETLETDGHAEPNLLADIARGKGYSREMVPLTTELERLPEDTPMEGEVMDILPNSVTNDATALPAGNVQSEDSTAIPPSPAWFVPQTVPPGIPLARLLDKAWEERAAGRPVQAASWFLTCLARQPTGAVCDEIIMDLCALLKENGYAKEALHLLNMEVCEAGNQELLARIRRELDA